MKLSDKLHELNSDPDFVKWYKGYRDGAPAKRKIRFYIDRNIPNGLVAEIRAYRHVFHISGTAGPRDDDPAVFAAAKQKKAILITCDEDFWNDRTFPLQQSPGVIIDVLLQPELEFAGAFLVSPFIGLFFFPPDEKIDVGMLAAYYWVRLGSFGNVWLLVYAAAIFNCGLAISSLQQFTKGAYWVLVIKPCAFVLGYRGKCRKIQKHLQTSSRYEDKAKYLQFLQWLDGQKDRLRVRSWEWFISNAYRTLDFLVFLFLIAHLVVCLCAWFWPDMLQVTVTSGSWARIALIAASFVVLIPGDIHHYEVRADGDELLYKEYRQWRKTQQPKA